MEGERIYKNRHKKAYCLVCGKSMRSDNLERHSKVHTDLLSLTDEKVIEELKLRQTVQMEREERRQKIEEIARKEGTTKIFCQNNWKIFDCYKCMIPGTNLNTKSNKP